MKNLTVILFHLIIIYCNAFSHKIKKEKCEDGQYWEYDAINYQNYPYTTFDQVGDISIEQQKENIRQLILHDKHTTPQGEFYIIYQSLWEFACKAMPDNVDAAGDAPGNLAEWAKAHAFIYYLNFDTGGHRFDSMYDANSFAWLAERAIQTMAYDVPTDPNKLLIRS
ncbi:MAG: hypothetical protein H7296_03935 [Bacteroidia bacterium]|nr:hypothetical protein [Bacteroidia bacterium]